MSIEISKSVMLECECGNKTQFAYRCVGVVTFEIENVLQLDGSGDMRLVVDRQILSYGPSDEEIYRSDDFAPNYMIICLCCEASRTRKQLEQKIDGYIEIVFSKPRP